ncbi:MAG: OB-fold nucleic acid binding domain-containing protein [Paracoccaceae bacterium]
MSSLSHITGPFWPKPPQACPAVFLAHPPDGSRVVVAGLVILRQRPGTAKGVIFLTLEDETGVINVIVWRNLFEAFRRAIISGRLLRVRGRLQREGGITHIIAEHIEDISPLLDRLTRPHDEHCSPPVSPINSTPKSGV